MKKLLIIGLLALSAFAYTNCAMCHNGGYKGKLNKYTPEQIESYMHQFKTQSMGSMARIANSMSDEEIKDAAQKYGKK